MSDLEALVQRCQRGDEAAFAEIFESQMARIFRLALTILRDRQDAEDVTQETFLRVFKRIGDYRGESSFQTWLTSIAVNLCRDRMRRRKLRSLVSLDWLRGRPGKHDVSDVVAERQQRQMLHAMVDRLDEPLRLTVILFYQQHLSCEEIAALCDVRTSTIYARLYKARTQLRAMLAQDHPREIDQEIWETSFTQNES